MFPIRKKARMLVRGLDAMWGVRYVVHDVKAVPPVGWRFGNWVSGLFVSCAGSNTSSNVRPLYVVRPHLDAGIHPSTDCTVSVSHSSLPTQGRAGLLAASWASPPAALRGLPVMSSPTAGMPGARTSSPYHPRMCAWLGLRCAACPLAFAVPLPAATQPLGMPV